MTNRPKRPRDANQLAKLIVDLATGEASEHTRPEKVASRQRAGQVGGKARAEKLSTDQRSAIGKKAAEARWKG